MVPRATAGSLERLEKRLLDYVSENGGGGIYFDYARYVNSNHISTHGKRG